MNNFPKQAAKNIVKRVVVVICLSFLGITALAISYPFIAGAMGGNLSAY